jgi:hypothetical protein
MILVTGQRSNQLNYVPNRGVRSGQEYLNTLTAEDRKRD